MFGFIEGFGEGMSGGEEKLMAIWDKLSDQVEAKRTALEKSMAGGVGGTASVAPIGNKGIEMAVSSDKLARIGGFVGMGGGPALDAARRTADSTSRTADGVQTLISTIDRLNMQPVWGT